jgi:outer membrane protein assembly factor BamB
VILLLAMIACAPARMRTVVPTLEATREDPPLPPPTLLPAPTGWRTGRVDAAPVLRAPVPAWSARLDGPIVDPVTTDGRNLYVVAEGRVHCFDLQGRERWSIRAGATGGVAVTELGPVVGTATGGLLVLDPDTGVTVRSTVAGGPGRGLAAQMDDGVAWLTIHGLLASTAGWAQEVGLSAAGGIAADAAMAWVATLEGELVAATSDAVRWRATLPAPAIDGPMIDEERVYVALGASDGVGGGVAAFTRDGQPLWRRRLDAQPSAPLSVGAFVYIPTRDGALLALDPATGADAWTAQADAAFSVQPIVTRAGQAYVADGSGAFFRLDEDGGVAWSLNVGAAVTGDPVLTGGLFVLGTADGRVVALRAPSSP